MFQSTNEYKEKEVTQDLGDMVINQHQDMCIMLYLTDNWVIKVKVTWRLDKVRHVFNFLFSSYGN